MKSFTGGCQQKNHRGHRVTEKEANELDKLLDWYDGCKAFDVSNFTRLTYLLIKDRQKKEDSGQLTFV